MSYSSFWRDLEVQFRALDQIRELRADWDYKAKSGGRGDWRVTGTSNTALRLHFERLARLAGGALDETGNQDSLQVWLDTLKDRSPNFEYGAQCEEQNEDGTRGPCHIRGRINRLAEASANLCIELEIEAIEAERRRTLQPEAVADGSRPAQPLNPHATPGSATPANSTQTDNTPAQVRKPVKGTADSSVAPTAEKPAREAHDKGNLELLRGKEFVTVRTACRFGGVKQRAIQAAISKGSLEAIGTHQNRRISVASLLKYFPSENSGR